MSEVCQILRRLPTFEAIDWQLSDLLVKGATVPSSVLEWSIALASRATRQGHVCLDLSRFESRRWNDAAVLGIEDPMDDVAKLAAMVEASLPSLSQWKKHLENSGVVGAPGESLPLILEGNRLYLERYFRHERALADALVSRLGRVRRNIDDARATAIVERWFSGAPELAKRAAEIVTYRRLCVLAGGPGTGKTSTVVRMLGALTELEGRSSGGSLRVLLLAPTGKAASRLSESIINAKLRLKETLPEVESLTTEAMTVHRALLSRERSHAGKRLPFLADLVVVDEASMVDLSLMRKLFEAASNSERVVLLGDPDQLASVEAGAVLGDICDSSLDDVVVKLVESHRFKDEGGIGRLASRIRRGDVEGVLEVLSHNDEAAQFVELPQTSPFTIEPLLERIGFGYEALRRARTPEEALTALERFRVLCVHRRGRFGVETWNDRLEERTVRFERSPATQPSARPLLVRENAEDSNLYNGDLGVLFADGGERVPRAYFRSSAGAISTYAVGRLPGHERAFAMSVHKSQGSEVDEVLVILPEATSPLLTRELLYTAVTRARKRCVIVGTREALKRCVQAKVTRQSGLSEALRASRPGS